MLPKYSGKWFSKTVFFSGGLRRGQIGDDEPEDPYGYDDDEYYDDEEEADEADVEEDVDVKEMVEDNKEEGEEKEGDQPPMEIDLGSVQEV